ncbi:MAG: hypothetical protein MUO33_12520 [Sedimentisphaerales bacterium]|nr:hypothetical protein [Sedimentisphaerales bacterium]
MSFWVQFWSWFFFISLALFVILAVVVLVGGFLNIRSLFRTLTKQAGAQESAGAEADKAEKLP